MSRPKCACCGRKIPANQPLPVGQRLGWPGVIRMMQGHGLVNPDFPGYLGSSGISETLAYARQHLSHEEYTALAMVLQPQWFPRR